MTVYKLRKHNAELFNKRIMKLMGDKMSNLGVREMGRIRYWDGSIREAEALSLYRRNSVNGLCGEVVIINKQTGEVINTESYEVVR
jgi:hypothetical protein